MTEVEKREGKRGRAIEKGEGKGKEGRGGKGRKRKDLPRFEKNSGYGHVTVSGKLDKRSK